MTTSRGIAHTETARIRALLSTSCFAHAYILHAASAHTVPGHTGSSPLDFCLYEGQPNCLHRGTQTPVVVRISSEPALDRTNALHGGTTALLGQQLVGFSDGQAIAPSRFSADAVRAHVTQPAITALGD